MRKTQSFDTGKGRGSKYMFSVNSLRMTSILSVFELVWVWIVSGATHERVFFNGNPMKQCSTLFSRQCYTKTYKILRGISENIKIVLMVTHHWC